jgi:glycerophosphoryl diester phosphodiesterase
MVHVVAHRGLRSQFPENTLEAVAAALRCPGVHGVEFDVELSRDGKPAVLHQETVVPNSKMTAVEPASRNFTSRDWVIENDLGSITRLDAGSWMGDEFAQIRVPTLQQMLDLPWGNVTAYVELKDATFWGARDLARPAKVVAAAYKDIAEFSGRVNVISFNPEILRELHRRLPQIPTTLALWTEWSGRASDALRLATGCDASALTLPDVLVLSEPEWIEAAHREGLGLHVYPVSPARGEPAFDSWTAESQYDKWSTLASLGVDALVSDFTAETLNLLSSQA